jgi:uncharacterized protein YjeT (DUF2065 family)
MTTWFFILGIPLTALGFFAVVRSSLAAKALVAFPRNRPAAIALCALAWIGTAYELDTIGIEVFDRFLKAFPFQLWIMAFILAVLTCWWMPNLLPIRGLAAIFMLFPAEMFHVIRLEPTQWRLVLVIIAYICIVTGMFGMFYPWRIRQFFAWVAEKPSRTLAAGAVVHAVGVLCFVLGCVL